MPARQEAIELCISIVMVKYCCSVMSIDSKSLIERCSKLHLRLHGNYSPLHETLAPSLRDYNGSLRAINFLN